MESSKLKPQPGGPHKLFSIAGTLAPPLQYSVLSPSLSLGLCLASPHPQLGCFPLQEGSPSQPVILPHSLLPAFLSPHVISFLCFTTSYSAIILFYSSVGFSIPTPYTHSYLTPLFSLGPCFSGLPHQCFPQPPLSA